MPARTPDPASTKAALLAVARRQFGTHGPDLTTIRSVAPEAGVDPALAMQMWGPDGLPLPLSPRASGALRDAARTRLRRDAARLGRAHAPPLGEA